MNEEEKKESQEEKEDRASEYIDNLIENLK